MQLLHTVLIDLKHKILEAKQFKALLTMVNTGSLLALPI